MNSKQPAGKPPSKPTTPNGGGKANAIVLDKTLLMTYGTLWFLIFNVAWDKMNLTPAESRQLANLVINTIADDARVN